MIVLFSGRTINFNGKEVSTHHHVLLMLCRVGCGDTRTRWERGFMELGPLNPWRTSGADSKLLKHGAPELSVIGDP